MRRRKAHFKNLLQAVNEKMDETNNSKFDEFDVRLIPLFCLMTLFIATMKVSLWVMH